MSEVKVHVDRFPSGETRFRVGVWDYHVSMNPEQAEELLGLLSKQLQAYGEENNQETS